MAEIKIRNNVITIKKDIALDVINGNNHSFSITVSIRNMNIPATILLLENVSYRKLKNHLKQHPEDIDVNGIIVSQNEIEAKLYDKSFKLLYPLFANAYIYEHFELVFK